MLPMLWVCFRGCPQFPIGEKLLLHESLLSNGKAVPLIVSAGFHIQQFDHRMSL